MESGKKIVIEVMYKADYCLPCLFMDAAVQEILPQYEDRVEYRRVDIMIGNGKKRFLGSPANCSEKMPFISRFGSLRSLLC